ncbi:MAG: formylglycine-generating enzyme family protein [Candidatus Poribacteria bacterium]|nr:formylglycine-generating enzyme family protein [Candidatus Poribacteria bacterium]
MNPRYITRFLLLVLFFVAAGCGKQEEAKRPPDTQRSTNQDESAPQIDAEMVLIPAGEFQMGSGAGAPDEQPVHAVYLDVFYIDRHEVTVGQYRQFVNATEHPPPDWGEVARYSETDQHPIVFVSWYDAMAYAKWAGKTLPTEAQWEYAARGGLTGQTYPWGDDPCDATKANYEDSELGKTMPVGSYPENGYGLQDMVGNVWEWCMDEYVPYFYATSPKDNPVSGGQIALLDDSFKNVETRRVVRGGGWDAVSRRLRVAHRDGNGPRGKVDSLGFRCARRVLP